MPIKCCWKTTQKLDFSCGTCIMVILMAFLELLCYDWNLYFKNLRWI